ncbi:MAG: M18 family aminopeptidase [Firmicutes bacterium]|nr:M18 family aminopeptidase [Bacillota bacterium]
MENAKYLIDFIEKAPSSYHSVLTAASELEAAGFTELELAAPWNIEAGKSYYINAYGTSLFAFTLGNEPKGRLYMAASHTDYPCFKIKPSPELSEKHYARLNTTSYGSVILNTWMDRPLSVAGKVMTKSDKVFKPQAHIIDIKRPILTIPNLAIHMNREVNKGVELNRQTDMLPLAAMVTEQLEKDDFFIKFLAEETGVKAEDILDFDLTLYAVEKGCITGINEEFISSPRIDNQTSVVSCLKGIIGAGVPEAGINFIACFDNEEIGSATKQGADSVLLKLILDKLYDTLGVDKMTSRDLILSGFFLSLDVAHAIHPCHSEKADVTNIPLLNGGIAIKADASQKYATDTEAIAAVRQLCEKAGVPYQMFVNRSDVAGGTTLGSINSSQLPMYTIDMGVPMLAMHSARELMGSKDQKAMDDLVTAFFRE